MSNNFIETIEVLLVCIMRKSTLRLRQKNPVRLFRCCLPILLLKWVVTEWSSRGKSGTGHSTGSSNQYKNSWHAFSYLLYYHYLFPHSDYNTFHITRSKVINSHTVVTFTRGPKLSAADVVINSINYRWLNMAMLMVSIISEAFDYEICNDPWISVIKFAIFIRFLKEIYKEI